MDVFYTIEEARDFVESHTLLGQSIGLVPTMGNLHAGHMRLVEKASAQADKVVVSVFVNPMQFGPKEDFSSYPRTLEADLEKLKNAGVAMVFVPKTATIYPEGAQNSTKVSVPKIAKLLEGEHRPAFFTGVATVVAKLFHILPATVAVFGKKDYQQLQVIQHMVADLCFPIKIMAVDTVREPDGLAMSSRNRYLSATERTQATLLFKTLQQAEIALLSNVPAKEVARNSARILEKAGFKVDYFSVRTKETLGEFSSPSQSVILVAATIGTTRLIDNLEVNKAL